jgi:hypothetical protein
MILHRGRLQRSLPFDYYLELGLPRAASNELGCRWRKEACPADGRRGTLWSLQELTSHQMQAEIFRKRYCSRDHGFTWVTVVSTVVLDVNVQVPGRLCSFQAPRRWQKLPDSSCWSRTNNLGLHTPDASVPCRLTGGEILSQTYCSMALCNQNRQTARAR